jgi:hypothetical protein
MSSFDELPRLPLPAEEEHTSILVPDRSHLEDYESSFKDMLDGLRDELLSVPAAHFVHYCRDKGWFVTESELGVRIVGASDSNRRY